MIADLRVSWLTAALCLVFPGTASAQRDTLEVDDVSPQLWMDYDPSVQLSPRVRLFGDFGARTQLETGGWWRIVARPSVRYDISGQAWIGGGFGNFYTFNEGIADRWELRPWQGVDVAWPKWKFPLRHYVRLEERFDFNTATWASSVSLRGRYRISLSRQWATIIREDRFWRAFGSLERFVSLAGEQGQSREQVRAMLRTRAQRGSEAQLPRRGRVVETRSGLPRGRVGQRHLSYARGSSTGCEASRLFELFVHSLASGTKHIVLSL